MRPVLMPLLLLTLTGCASNGVLLGRDRLSETRRQFKSGAYDKVLADIPQARMSEIPRRQRPEAYYLLGSSYERKKEPEKALQVYQLSVGLYPRDLKLVSALADILDRVGLPDRALPYYQRVLNIHPNNASAHLGLAGIHLQQGYLVKALEHYRETLKQWSDNPHVWRKYARALARSGDLEAAVQAANISLHHRYDTDVQADLARFQRGRGLRAESYTEFQKAIDDDPARTDLLPEKALWLLQDGRLEEARTIADSTLARDPDEPLARWLRASVALRRGELGLAREDLTVAAGAARTHPFIAQTARAMLDRLGAGGEPAP